MEATATPTGTNPLISISGTLKGIFQDASDVYFGYQQRVAALDLLESETNKNNAAYTAADKAVPTNQFNVNMKNLAIGAGVLLVSGIVLARILK